MTLVACLAALPAFCAAANPPAARLIYSRPDRQYGAETFSVTALFDRPLVGAEVFISVASPSRRGKTLVEKAPMSASRSGRFFRFARAVAETGADDGTFEITLRVEEDGKEPVDVVPSNDRFAIAASRSAESGDFAARADSARRSAAAGTLALPGEVAIEEQVLVPQAPQAPVYAPYGYYDPQQYYSSGYTPVYGYANSSPFFASTFGYGDYFIPSTRYRHHQRHGGSFTGGSYGAGCVAPSPRPTPAQLSLPSPSGLGPVRASPSPAPRAIGGVVGTPMTLDGRIRR